MTDTQNGQIDIRGGSVSEYVSIGTQTGNALISGTSLPDEKDTPHASRFAAVSGTIIFQPPDSVENYCLNGDYGEEAVIFFNREGYEEIDMTNSGDAGIAFNSDGTNPGVQAKYTKKLVFTINEGAPKKVNFYSPKGTLIIQEK